MPSVWDPEPPIDASQVQELISQMGLTQVQFAEVMNVTQPTVNRWVKAKAPVEGPASVLMRWLFAVYGIQGGRTPTPKIPLQRIKS